MLKSLRQHPRAIISDKRVCTSSMSATARMHTWTMTRRARPAATMDFAACRTMYAPDLSTCSKSDTGSNQPSTY